MTAPRCQPCTRPLADCGLWLTGGTPSRSNSAYWNGTIPWISAKSLKSFRLTDSDERLTPLGAENGSRIVPKGALLFVVRGMSLANEFRVGVASRPVALNQDLRALIPATGIDSMYLAHFLRHAQQDILALVDRASHGTTRLATERLGSLPVPVPPLPEQHRIAAILDKADDLRAKRRAALAQLDALAQSVFVEMFGDPTANPHNLPREELQSLCDSPDDIKCGPFGTQLARNEFKNAGVPLWGIKHVNASFLLGTHEYLADGTARRLVQYSVKPGDIVMTRKGTVGNCAVYPPTLPLGIMHSDLLRLRVSRRKCDPVFLAHQLHHSRDVERQVSVISGGAVMPGINVTKLKGVRVLVPPLHSQESYARTVACVDGLKAVQREALGQSEALFVSLQHRAFRGEL